MVNRAAQAAGTQTDVPSSPTRITVATQVAQLVAQVGQRFSVQHWDKLDVSSSQHDWDHQSKTGAPQVDQPVATPSQVPFSFGLHSQQDQDPCYFLRQSWSPQTCVCFALSTPCRLPTTVGPTCPPSHAPAATQAAEAVESSDMYYGTTSVQPDSADPRACDATMPTAKQALALACSSEDVKGLQTAIQNAEDSQVSQKAVRRAKHLLTTLQARVAAEATLILACDEADLAALENALANATMNQAAEGIVAVARDRLLCLQAQQHTAQA